MKIRTLWAASEADDEMPWLVAACDEYVVDALGDVPDDYREQMKPEHRELVIEIPGAAVINLFKVPVVKGTVK